MYSSVHRCDPLDNGRKRLFGTRPFAPVANTPYPTVTRLLNSTRTSPLILASTLIIQMGDKLSDISTLPSPLLPTYHLPPIVFRNRNFQASYSDMASSLEVENIFTSDEYLDLMSKNVWMQSANTGEQ